MKLAVLAIQEKVTEIRKSLGITQEQFATVMGVHPMTVSKWENGRRTMDAETQARLERVASALRNLQDVRRSSDELIEALLRVEDYMASIDTVDEADTSLVKSLLLVFVKAKSAPDVQVYKKIFCIDSILPSYQEMCPDGPVMITEDNIGKIKDEIQEIFDEAAEEDFEDLHETVESPIGLVQIGEHISIWCDKTNEFDAYQYVVYHNAGIVYIWTNGGIRVGPWEKDEQNLIDMGNYYIDLNGGFYDFNPDAQ
ncbi:helix-turn-helix domain-containing protein [Alicyclobacillus fastidiosus]|uniref:Helix-turn-helix transcriptional regulator n=1 Tax=Alicyclobacillus fastidiosus TaxID=392011 RepID=A0ABV5AHG7_9BACL|nr:helix-turn-helix transcriptional regulator [Alicyclobacillus fastidiosus]WEH09183.1 helix-turn-helix transcriptional regulator [Alicyclobacillus fastidiosus]